VSTSIFAPGSFLVTRSPLGVDRGDRGRTAAVACPEGVQQSDAPAGTKLQAKPEE